MADELGWFGRCFGSGSFWGGGGEGGDIVVIVLIDDQVNFRVFDFEEVYFRYSFPEGGVGE